VQKHHATLLKGAPDRLVVVVGRDVTAALEMADRAFADMGARGQLGLGPVQQAASGAALCGRDHGLNLPERGISGIGKRRFSTVYDYGFRASSRKRLAWSRFAPSNPEKFVGKKPTVSPKKKWHFGRTSEICGGIGELIAMNADEQPK